MDHLPYQDGSVDAGQCGGAGHCGKVNGEVRQCGQFVELGNAPLGQEELGVVGGAVVAQHRGEEEDLRGRAMGGEGRGGEG